MHVPPLHQAAHLAGQPPHLQRFLVHGPLEGVEGAHDVGDGAETVQLRMGRRGLLRLRQQRGVGLLHHLLAEVDEHQVVLEEGVVEHELGRLAQVHDPLRQRGRLDAVGHVLCVDRAGGVVVAADAADAAGDEMGVARVLAPQKDAVAAEQGGGDLALGNLPVLEVDLGVHPEVADDPGDGVPVHLHQIAVVRL